MGLQKNSHLNMSASASLSGGPAKEAEKGKKAESYQFLLLLFCHFYILVP